MPSSDTPQTPAWLTGAQARELLSVSDSTLRRWADTGGVRTFRTPGKHRRYNAEDITSLLAGEPRPTSEQPAQVPA